ncbi:hypothetical protein HK405_011490 [Cladochytrium tenue]|nr:hypothetical protein HK405_011490 [Cladochytrium tenue]
MSHPDVLDFLVMLRDLFVDEKPSTVDSVAESSSERNHTLRQQEKGKKGNTVTNEGLGRRRRLHKEAIRCLSSALRIAIGARLMVAANIAISNLPAPVALQLLHGALSLFLLHLVSPFLQVLHAAADSAGVYSEKSGEKAVPPIARLTPSACARYLADIATCLDRMSPSCPAAGSYFYFVRRLQGFARRRAAFEPGSSPPSAMEGDGCQVEPGAGPASAAAVSQSQTCAEQPSKSARDTDSSAPSSSPATAAGSAPSHRSDAELLMAVRQFCAAPFSESVHTLVYLNRVLQRRGDGSGGEAEDSPRASGGESSDGDATGDDEGGDGGSSCGSDDDADNESVGGGGGGSLGGRRPQKRRKDAHSSD